jgi:hypothetical protein
MVRAGLQMATHVRDLPLAVRNGVGVVDRVLITVEQDVNQALEPAMEEEVLPLRLHRRLRTALLLHRLRLLVVAVPPRISQGQKLVPSHTEV